MKRERILPFGTRIKLSHPDEVRLLSVQQLEIDLQTEGLVLIRGAKLAASELKRFSEEFSGLEPTDLLKSEDSVNGVLRVCSDRDEAQRPLGIFGHESELDWHANRPSSHDRKSLVLTYGARGCEDTQTWWLNTEMAFKELSLKKQQLLRATRGFYGFKPGSYTEENYKHHRNSFSWPLVFKRYGREILYLPFNQIVEYEYDKIEQTSESAGDPGELMQEIIADLLNSQWIYKHHWLTGDLIISDQWTTIHKRPKCKMEGRKILRTTFNYSYDSFPDELS